MTVSILFDVHYVWETASQERKNGKDANKDTDDTLEKLRSKQKETIDIKCGSVQEKTVSQKVAAGFKKLMEGNF